MNLGSLVAPRGARKKRKRLGRGEGSGHGGTSTRGHKGQKARAGGFHKRGFEGGQMPLIRRLPKRGFFNFSRQRFEVVNVNSLNVFAPETVVDIGLLREQGLVKGKRDGVKILGEGELKVPLTIKAHRFSQSAQRKITQAGGRVEVVS